MSETDFVDSTSATLLIAATVAPVSGGCTNTTSPSASCAKSVIPTRARPPSTETHSCSFVYRNPSGNSMPGCLPQNLADPPRVLLGELPGVLVALAFGPDVREGLLRVRQHESPPVRVQHLHPIDQQDVARAGPLDHLPHDGALALPRCRNGLVRDVQAREPPHDGRKRPIDRREQVQQLDERRRG